MPGTITLRDQQLPAGRRVGSRARRDSLSTPILPSVASLSRLVPLRRYNADLGKQPKTITRCALTDAIEFLDRGRATPPVSLYLSLGAVSH
jgi:hypothetical protein